MRTRIRRRPLGSSGLPEVPRAVLYPMISFPRFLSPGQIGLPLHMQRYPFNIRSQLLPVDIFAGDQLQVILDGVSDISIRIPELSNIKSLGSANVIQKTLDPSEPGFNPACRSPSWIKVKPR